MLWIYLFSLPISGAFFTVMQCQVMNAEMFKMNEHRYSIKIIIKLNDKTPMSAFLQFIRVIYFTYPKRMPKFYRSEQYVFLAIFHST